MHILRTTIFLDTAVILGLATPSPGQFSILNATDEARLHAVVIAIHVLAKPTLKQFQPQDMASLGTATPLFSSAPVYLTDERGSRVVGGTAFPTERCKEAVAVCRDVVGRFPQLSIPWSELGKRLAAAGQWQEVLEAWNRAPKPSRKTCAFAASLAAALKKLGHDPEAVEALAAAGPLPRRAQASGEAGCPVGVQRTTLGRRPATGRCHGRGSGPVVHSENDTVCMGRADSGREILVPLAKLSKVDQACAASAKSGD